MTPSLNLDMRFLCCDDEDSDLMMLGRFLKPIAESFDSAISLKQAMQKCIDNEYDVLILDLSLTDSNWEDTLASIHKIRQLRPLLKIVVCSGMPVFDLKDRAILAGADSFVKKDHNLYRDSAAALMQAVYVATLHSTPDDKFWPRVQMLRQIVEHVSEN